jgi:cell division protein FtsL
MHPLKKFLSILIISLLLITTNTPIITQALENKIEISKKEEKNDKKEEPNQEKKTQICHNRKTLEINEKALPTHLSH